MAISASFDMRNMDLILEDEIWGKIGGQGSVSVQQKPSHC